MASKIDIVSEIVIDSFWSSKLKQKVWRVTVEFLDDSTPYRNFTETQEKAIDVASWYWEEIEKNHNAKSRG